MTMRTVHARVRARRQLELAEDINLPDGSDVVLTFDVSEDGAAARAKAKAEFGEYDLGFQFPLNRAELYDDER